MFSSGEGSCSDNFWKSSIPNIPQCFMQKSPIFNTVNEHSSRHLAYNQICHCFSSMKEKIELILSNPLTRGPVCWMFDQNTIWDAQTILRILLIGCLMQILPYPEKSRYILLATRQYGRNLLATTFAGLDSLYRSLTFTLASFQEINLCLANINHPVHPSVVWPIQPTEISLQTTHVTANYHNSLWYDDKAC